MRKRRERSSQNSEKPRAKNKGRLGYRENVPGKEKDWLQRLISKEKKDNSERMSTSRMYCIYN